jgi:hypothetical protein
MLRLLPIRDSVVLNYGYIGLSGKLIYLLVHLSTSVRGVAVDIPLYGCPTFNVRVNGTLSYWLCWKNIMCACIYGIDDIATQTLKRTGDRGAKKLVL